MEDIGLKARVIMTRKGVPSCSPEIAGPFRPALHPILASARDPLAVIGIVLHPTYVIVFVSYLGTYYIDRADFPDPFAFDDVESPADLLTYILEMYLEMEARK